MDKFITIKKACKLLECNEEQLYQVINDQPRLIRNRGTGMERKLCEYDVLEWKKRSTTMNHQLTRAVPNPTKEIKYKIVQHYPAPKPRKKRGKEVIYVDPPTQKITVKTTEKTTAQPTEKRNRPAMTPAPLKKKNHYKVAPPTIQQGEIIFHNLANVCESLGRAQATIMVWMKKSSFKIVELSDPAEKDSVKRKYIREGAVKYLTKIAAERKPLNTQKSQARAAGQDSMELITIPDAAKIMKVKDARVRHLVSVGKLKGYGPNKLAVKIYEVRKALLKSHTKPAPRKESKAAASIRETLAKPIPMASAPIHMFTQDKVFDAAPGVAISELDKEILNKALDMSLQSGDLSILRRVLQLLGA